MNDAEKNKIIARAREIFRAKYIGGAPNQACFYWAKAGVIAAREFGYADAQIQAGSAQWPRLPYDDDRQFYGYEWHGIDWFETIRILAEGGTPELHCWVGFVKQEMILDLASGYQAGNALNLGGLDWQAKLLPDCLFMSLDELRARQWYYAPAVDAIGLVLRILTLSTWGGLHIPPFASVIESLNDANRGEAAAMRMEGNNYPLAFNVRDGYLIEEKWGLQCNT